MTIRRGAALAAPALALVLVASACSGGEEGGNENEETLADIPAIDINPVAREDVEDGGDFHWGINEYPTQYNMSHPDGNLGNVRDIVEAVLPTAHVYDETGAPSPNPAFVESSEVSEDGLTVTFRLNPDAEWSTGEPITWEDYAEQAETVGGAREGDFLVGSPDGYELIEETERGENDHEVIFHFAEPYGDWPKLFAPLYPKEYMTDPEEFNEGYVGDIPVTAGPFGDVEFDDTAQTIILNKNEDWWGEPAKLDRIIFHGYENDALAQVYNNDEIDGFYLGTDVAGYELLRDKEGSRMTRAVNNGYRFIQFNGSSPKLEDVEVRRALTHAIDREALAQATMGPIDWPTDPTVNRLLRSSQTGFQDNSEGLAEFDPELAAQMLDEAGWTQPEEGATRVNEDGEELELRWVISSGLQTMQDEAEIAQAMLSEIGVAVNIESVPNTEYFTGYIIPGNYEVAAFVLTGSNPYASDSGENYGGPFGETEDGEPDWGNNTGKVSTEEINAKFDELQQETDPERYAEIANEIDRLIWENAQNVPFFQRPGRYVVNEDIANWGETGLASLRYEDIGWVAQGS
ncbi:ABC transporter family substrate-binding protein [Marinactinospora rubrisoli]|uniref:ABC transporter family substrate-binding protein n=1 Tax=Marinactinospora rubrisoli TaxID=2715399 RepID=A0ABW2KIN0_9ACTN